MAVSTKVPPLPVAAFILELLEEAHVDELFVLSVISYGKPLFREGNLRSSSEMVGVQKFLPSGRFWIMSATLLRKPGAALLPC